jgi:carbon monoxide dehydrogenase subunit G
VTAFEAPKRITFQQNTVSMLGTLEVEIRYTLESAGDGTRVIREVDVRPGGAFGLVQGRLLKSITQESERILATMKAWLEKTK